MDWARDTGPVLTAEMIQEYLTLWTQMGLLQIDQEASDSNSWLLESDGWFSARSAYEANFKGREVVPTAEFTWNSMAPL